MTRKKETIREQVGKKNVERRTSNKEYRVSKRDFNFRFTIKGFVLTKDGLGVNWYLKNIGTSK